MPDLGIFNSPSQAAEERGMGLFAPPGAPVAPPPEPTPAPPERAEPAPAPEPAPPEPTPAPPERPRRPRRPRREPEAFESDELWQAFLDAKYQGGRALIQHPDPRQRQRRRNYPEPRVKFNTGMNYENFRRQVQQEFEAWKQEQQGAAVEEPRHRPSDLSVGEAIQHIDQLREGDVIESINGAVMRVTGIDDDHNHIRYQWRREDGRWSSRTRTLGAHAFPNRSYTLREREVPDAAPPDEPAERRVEVGGMVEDTDQLRPGDVIQNEWLQNYDEARKVLEVRDDGSLLTQKFNTETGENVGAPTVISREQVQREGAAYAQYTQYKRIPAEVESEEGHPGEPAPGEPEAERLKIGDKVERPDQLRVGDIFQNDYLRDSMDNQRRVVVSVRNGEVKTRIIRPNGDHVPNSPPTTLTQDFLDSHGPYTVLAAVGTAVERPGDVGPGTYIQAPGKPLLRVVAAAQDHLLVQVVSEDTGHPHGRPTKIDLAEIEELPYKVAAAPSRIQDRSGEGLPLTRPQDFREGEIVKILHEDKPIWAKVTAQTSRSVTLKPMNPRTGRPARDAAHKLNKADLEQWADVRRSQNIPARLQPPPPPLVEPEGGFARPGAGKLTPNTQPTRYDHVRFNLGRAEAQTRSALAQKFGDLAEGKDPVHLAADLAGVGGLAKSASSVTITVADNHIRVRTSGRHIVDMDRYIYFDGPGQPSHVSNSYFKLADDAPDGMGLKAFATQVAAARDAGFKQIKVQAAGDHDNIDSDGRFIDGDLVGYWVWPRFGYDAAFPEAFFRMMPASIKEQIRRVKPGAPAGLRFLDVFSSGPEAREWWKFNGKGRGMTFKLGPASRSLKYLTAYVQEKAQMRDQGADEFLNRAARLRERLQLCMLERILAAADAPKKTIFDEPDEENEGGRVEVPQPMTDKDIEISDRIFDRMGDEMRRENEKGESPGGNMNEHDKKATAAVADLANKDPEFRAALLREIVGAAGVRDFAVDQFSQVSLLMNLRAGDKVDIAYRPGDRPEPAVKVERIVQNDYDPVIRGVTLQTPTGAEGMLVDKGEPQGILYWDGPNTPGYVVMQIGLARSKFAQEEGDKATAAQVQFALDLAKEKGKDYSKSDLQKKTKAQISTLIEAMQGEANVASDKQVAYALSLLNEAGRKSPSKASLEKMPEADVSKLIDELKAKGDKKASLLDAMGGRTRLAAMVGARNVEEGPGALSFEWSPRAPARGNKVAVEAAEDALRVTFLLKTARGERRLRSYDGVSPDELVDVFERQTGLFLRL